MKFTQFGRSTLASLLFVVAGIAVTPAVARADDDKKAASEAKTLSVGDKAPALRVERFLKGSPVEGFKEGHVYVVEMWATWCGPCIAMFPHLSELQEKHKDKATIIGVNVWEDRKDAYSDKTREKVTKFIADRDTMNYTIAYDGGAKEFVKTWAEPAKVMGIPHAFIVDQKGTIAWMGHPGGMDKPLEKIIAGTWDPARAKDADALSKKANAALRKGDEEGALKVMMEKVEKFPDMAEDEAAMIFGYHMQTGKAKEGLELARKWVDGPLKDSAQALNGIAWTIVDPQSELADKDLDLALKAAQRANELTGNKDAAILDTLAHAYFAKGDKAKAIETQTLAVSKADGAMKEDLERSLERFKN